MSTGALERLIRRGQPAVPTQCCDLCAAPIAERHRHLLDVENADVNCSCQACTILFAGEHAQFTDSGSVQPERRYRVIPQRRTRLDDVSMTDLGVPVGLAFFVCQSDGAVVAHYPSPMGATQWEVDQTIWRRVVAACEPVRAMQCDVEALLVNTARNANEHWVVPIDDCFRLVAIVRREWRGWSGGNTVWPLIKEFFDQLGTGSRHG
ncbi:MAG: DUF5947 family protein [Acidothermaceae bacterium]